jgi:hypothetical protein
VLKWQVYLERLLGRSVQSFFDEVGNLAVKKAAGLSLDNSVA